ncbi:MAG: hypothetical protein ABFD46_02345 [Armatimonadota bacterium]
MRGIPAAKLPMAATEGGHYAYWCMPIEKRKLALPHSKEIGGNVLIIHHFLHCDRFAQCYNLASV